MTGNSVSDESGKAGFSLIIVFLMLVFSAGLWAQEGYTLEAVRFTPPEFHVGEQVELRITLGVPEDVPVIPPSELPEISWVTLRDFEVIRNGALTDIRILFASFQPGLRTLPAFDLGGIRLEPIKVHTTSVLDVDPPPFQDAAGQLLLPGTAFFLILGIALLLIVPVLILSLGPRLKGLPAEILARRRYKRPLERLNRVLSDLKSGKRTGQGDPFYSLLTRELRIYLSSRTGKDFLSATTGEFGCRLGQVVPDTDLTREISRLLIRGDEARFGGRKVKDDECSAALDTVEKAAALVEELLESRKKQKGKAV